MELRPGVWLRAVYEQGDVVRYVGVRLLLDGEPYEERWPGEDPADFARGVWIRVDEV